MEVGVAELKCKDVAGNARSMIQHSLTAVRSQYMVNFAPNLALVAKPEPQRGYRITLKMTHHIIPWAKLQGRCSPNHVLRYVKGGTHNENGAFWKHLVCLDMSTDASVWVYTLIIVKNPAGKIARGDVSSCMLYGNLQDFT